jgi:mxaK protein
MTRRPIHLGFGIAAALLAGLSGSLAFNLERAEGTNALIANAVAHPDTTTEAKTDTPEAALARAIAIAQGEDYERALRAYEPLTTSPNSAVRQIARYDLGNLHMRQSARIVDFEVAKARTLVELGKQWYRRVLEDEPLHWEARYNLERALWLEPESDDLAVETPPPPAVERPNGDKPELP